MSAFVVTLVIVSTFMHAGWNLLARGQRDEGAFFRRMLLVSMALGLAPAAVGWAMLRCLTPTALACALGSGVCCGVYYLGLARGYGSGDFTVVYPAARALPVLLLGLVDVARGRLPTAMGWSGMVLVALGCFLVPHRSFRKIRLAPYLDRSVLWILLTALGTVGYSILDKIGLENTPEGPAQAAIYGYVFFVISGVAYLGLDRLFRAPRDADVKFGWRLPALAAVLNFGAYWLVLWAYQMTERVSYVVAFRQFSIVLGVIAAFIIFRESGRLVRTAGTLVITAGLVVLKLWGG